MCFWGEAMGPFVLLFVYGTLQRGENNYAWWMADPKHATFVATARTVKRYPLFVKLLPGSDGCSPCLLNQPAAGDVGDVSNCNERNNDAGGVTPQFVVGELFLVTPTLKSCLDVIEDVEEGVYTVGEIDVLPLDNEQVVERTLHVGKGEAVRALVYFRTKNYPPDWNCPSAANSTCLMQRFSAMECLRLYGSRFAGFPAHLRYAAELRDGLQRHTRWPFDDVCGVPLRPKPIVLFIIDGVGDATYSELGHRTPLEVVAGVPPRRFEGEATAKSQCTADRYASSAMNLVTKNGVSGLMDVFESGVSCGSDTAHLALLGYPPKQYYRGRGAYEALGAGLALDDADIAFKSNFSVLNESTGIVTHRRCDRDFTQEGPVLCAHIDGTVIAGDDAGLFESVHTLRAQYATEHRCGIAITGKGLSCFITGTDPLADNRPLLHCRPTVPPEHAEYEAALYTSRVVNAASRCITELLRHHPINEARRREGKEAANVVLLRGAADKGWVPPFAVRHGLFGFIVAPTCIIKGLGICCGLKSVGAAGATGDYQTNVNAKVDAALSELGLAGAVDGATREEGMVRSVFAVIHVKGVDDAGHDRSLEKKLMMLQRCGEALQRLWTALPDGSTVAVLSDHSTPVSIGDHSCEPVPVSVATKGCGFHDDVEHYSEVECGYGALGRFRGEELLGIVKRAHYWYHYRAPRESSLTSEG
ncbi:2,3-bisphosphoglycerate-independent phosphoglycerate mutase, putative [Trypanosoma cruzi]|uniref:2,3-bisphosphoglycerate-independent phosphoglycerate mutase, putative n=1 Tax=Trypanosoma cruzi (strain CL Brener) TaxID=353153 RepID=Q4D422_TRYCC|nr:2,3-bisphosphoglycerate-independent phosphoglycerate mutase, putative [Trypanosoma cruzi]EAN87268.1 2,3-bisphosphoglycerate-independent phosphoglycerate mutase, putative [Trypanosoma cruzi]|eukprot:XP_809119.1 2,3-bisphosphoglycerate-independent phosphoglycerate mutase [Trypanosoma cruzi strain CL Brener]